MPPKPDPSKTVLPKTKSVLPKTVPPRTELPKSQLKDEYENLSAEGKAIVTIMQDEFQKLRLEFMGQLDSKDEQIQELRDQVTSLKEQMSKVRETIDENDAYERRDTVILSGNSIPIFSQGENPTNLAIEAVKNELKIQISPSDVSVAHRMGRKPANQQPDRRGIIVKLCRRDLKHSLISASKKMVPRSRSNLYVNEHLTPARKTILYALRQMKKDHPDLVKGCTSWDGRVYAFTPPPAGSPPSSRDQRHLVNSRDSLVTFCSDYVQKPLNAFLDNWSF